MQITRQDTDWVEMESEGYKFCISIKDGRPEAIAIMPAINSHELSEVAKYRKALFDLDVLISKLKDGAI